MEKMKEFLLDKARSSRKQHDHAVQMLADASASVAEWSATITQCEAMAIEFERLAGLYGAVAPVNTQGPEGTEVQHLDVPTEDDAIRFVWLNELQCSPDQRLSAVGTDNTGKTPMWAIPFGNLTEAQQHMYGDKVVAL